MKQELTAEYIRLRGSEVAIEHAKALPDLTAFVIRFPRAIPLGVSALYHEETTNRFGEKLDRIQ